MPNRSSVVPARRADFAASVEPRRRSRKRIECARIQRGRSTARDGSEPGLHSTPPGRGAVRAVHARARQAMDCLMQQTTHITVQQPLERVSSARCSRTNYVLTPSENNTYIHSYIKNCLNILQRLRTTLNNIRSVYFLRHLLHLRSRARIARTSSKETTHLLSTAVFFMISSSVSKSFFVATRIIGTSRVSSVQ